jgi:outer membrane protein assembly factor BamD (BamD/ComL family)
MSRRATAWAMRTSSRRITPRPPLPSAGARKPSDMPKNQRNDAMVRTGDCYFATKDEANAISWYDKAIAAGASASDYAMYQKGVCQGLQKKYRREDRHAEETPLTACSPTASTPPTPSSSWAKPTSIWSRTTKPPVLRPSGRPISQQPARAPSMLQSALIDKRQGRTDKALDGFKAVVAKYPTADGAHDALAGIERIYVDQGKVAAYEAYVRSLELRGPGHTGSRRELLPQRRAALLRRSMRQGHRRLRGLPGQVSQGRLCRECRILPGRLPTTAPGRPRKPCPDLSAPWMPHRISCWNRPSQRLPPSNSAKVLECVGALHAVGTTCRAAGERPGCTDRALALPQPTATDPRGRGRRPESCWTTRTPPMT